MAKDNSNITMKGSKISVSGSSLTVGAPLPQFTLTATDMSDLPSSQFNGKTLVIIAVPSLDTPICSIETKRFNKEASAISNDVVVLAVSRDLPFAQKRWCGAEEVERVQVASDYKYRTFGQKFGVEWTDSALLARAVFVADKSGKLVYVDYVSDIAEEPKYDEVLDAVKKAG